MIEITITTKAGKFVMKGEELAERFEAYVQSVDYEFGTYGYALEEFLSTYEEEPCVCELYHLNRKDQCPCKKHNCQGV